MTKKLKQIQLTNLDKRFNQMRFEPKPKSGWIKTIREALSMPLAFPAKKLKISQPSVARLEKNEIDESITLKSLRQLAAVMNCELHYAIIPHQKSLKKIVEKRSEQKARSIVNDVNNTMSLEDQKIKDPKRSVKFLAKEFAEDLKKSLWHDDEN
ncbi:MAG: helix-turn-helix domain-containing protein [Proteobacteria bacterium]|nr:helix-turn-helix domain-containing protein [Pseudomonadota bacterium]